MPFHSHLLSLCWVSLLCLLLQACGAEEAVEPPNDADEASTESEDQKVENPPLCVLGRVVACPCRDQTMGTQTCVDKGRHFTACECEASDDGVQTSSIDASVDEDSLPSGEGATTYVVKASRVAGSREPACSWDPTARSVPAHWCDTTWS